MPTEIDVYQVCPCGSGKKIKFCCQPIIGEMKKVLQLQQNHQNQMALQALENLEKKPLREAWSRAWVKTTKAWVLVALNQLNEAHAALADVLRELPEHQAAIALDAMVLLGRDGYDAARDAIGRAFRHAGPDSRHILADLARFIGGHLVTARHYLAARQHFGLATQFDPENEQRFEEFFELEGDEHIPFPLRSNHRSRPFSGAERLRPQFDEAALLSARGCWHDAAEQFRALAAQEPQNAVFWHNAGLCHTWAGEEVPAMEALRASARVEADFETAVEDEALAQMLAARSVLQQAELVLTRYRVQSVSKLLTLLDQQERYARMTLKEPEPGDEDESPTPLGGYAILNRDRSTLRPDQLTPETVACRLAFLSVFDADDGQKLPAHLNFIAFAGEESDRVRKEFEQIAAGEVEPTGNTTVLSSVPTEHHALLQDWYIPPSTPPNVSHRLEKARSHKVVHDVWPNLPLEALGRKTPSAAAGAPELKVPLAAAVLVFAAFCEGRGFAVDEELLRSRLGLPPLARLDVSDDANLWDYSVLQMRRMPLHELTDSQLVFVVNRSTLLHYGALAYQALTASCSRPAVTEKSDPRNIYLHLARLCRQRFSHEEALVWLAKGKQEARARHTPLEQMLVWDLQELFVRSDEPGDPQFAALAAHLWNYYGAKLPGVRQPLAGILGQYGLPGPWNNPTEAARPVEQLAAAGATSAGGIWTPGAPAEEGASKLWLPGQE